MSADQPTIFVVDDDPTAVQSVVALLQARGYPCRGYGSPAEFLREYNPAESGCLVTDLAMPGMTGLELHCELTSRGWLIPTIIVSGQAEISEAVQAMKQGAITVLEKPFQHGRLLEAIQAALDSELALRTRVRKLVRLNHQFAQLTPGENDVLERLVAGQSNKVIAFELGVAVRTIEHRRRNIYHKLDVDSVALLVARVVEREQLLSGVPDVRALANATRWVGNSPD